ncbi:MAG: ZIP family metal transporter [Desulfomonilia bacterium]
MKDIVLVLSLSVLAGITIPVGGILARVEHIRPRWLEEEFRHSVIAFGGGALLAALSLVLIPEGIRNLSLILVISAFLGGGLFFLWIDRCLANRGDSVSQLMAMLLDFIPEALALGALLSSGERTAVLLAFLIALQNLPEAFNAYREMIAGSRLSSAAILGLFSGLVFLGPLSAVLGISLFATRETLLGVIMVFSAGGILYLIFHDIAPQVKLKNHWAPSLGAVCGFLLGVIGHVLIH